MKYDVIIIGGGITGAGILRDCALRGLKAVCLDKGEFGHATTASSTHLIHGGLRYLLYDRLTTHTTCWDSGNIVRIARPLLTRLPILWPIYKDHQHKSETVETLLESYDGFSRMKEGLPHLRLSAEETLKIIPTLEPERLVGSVSFDEWWVDPVGLVNANLESGKRAGGECRSKAKVTRLLIKDKTVGGVEIESGGKRETLEAPVVINASGPWVDQVARMAGLRVPMRLQKGTHLIYKNSDFLNSPQPDIGLLLEAADGVRYVFVIKIGDQILVGPTDLPGPGDPDEVRTTRDELHYLLDSAKRYFKNLPPQYDQTIVGARPILEQSGSEKLLSREYEIIDHEARAGIRGFFTVGGGKMSDFRLMAHDGVDLACRKLGKDAACATAESDFAGNALGPRETFPAPWRPVKKFLRRHPRLRELHALAYLGAAFARHWVLKSFGQLPQSTAQQFRAHYNH